MTPRDEELLNAFVDGELSPANTAEVLRRLKVEPQLSRRACDLEKLKKQVRLSYADVGWKELPRSAHRRLPARTIAAGILAIAVGGVLGWLAHTNPADTQRLVVLDPTGRGQTPATADSREMRIVFHLKSQDQIAAGELLDEVERLLSVYAQEQRPLRVEIVSHGEGLALLRERMSTHKERVHALARTFQNLTFVACLNTMDRLRVEQGIEVNLVPDAAVTRSGVSHIVKRQREGWAYIRV